MELINLQSARLIKENKVKRSMMNQELEDGNDPEAPIKLDMLENEIYEATYKASIDTEIHLTYANKIEHDNQWNTYRERT